MIFTRYSLFHDWKLKFFAKNLPVSMQPMMPMSMHRPASMRRKISIDLLFVIGELLQFVRVEKDGDRTGVDKINLHVRPETACFDL